MQPQSTQPAQATQRAQSDSRRINRIKLALGCSGVGMLLFTGVAMFLLIITPLVFRNLPSDRRASLVTRFPFMVAFQPTRPFDKYLPTVQANGTNAVLLLTPVTGVVTATAA